MAIDWSAPLEAHHEDGRSVHVKLDGGFYPDKSGYYRTTASPAPDANEWWFSTGESACSEKWRLRNRAADQSSVSLRDYFAGQAINAIYSRPLSTDGDEGPMDVNARDAYRIADAMLAARQESAS